MEFPATAYSAATRTVPTTFAAWGALSQPALTSLYGKMTHRMLVLVEGSQLAAAAPDLPFAVIDGQKALPLHEIILFYGRLLWAADDALDTDLSVLAAPSNSRPSSLGPSRTAGLTLRRAERRAFCSACARWRAR